MNNLELLKFAKVIAVLGFSPDQMKTSNLVAKFLIDTGYRVYLVNPNYAGKECFGKPILSSLAQIPEHIDIIDVFRKSESIPSIIDEIIAIKPGTVWFQPGISSPESEVRIREAGINVVTDKCTMKELG